MRQNTKSKPKGDVGNENVSTSFQSPFIHPSQHRGNKKLLEEVMAR